MCTTSSDEHQLQRHDRVKESTVDKDIEFHHDPSLQLRNIFMQPSYLKPNEAVCTNDSIVLCDTIQEQCDTKSKFLFINYRLENKLFIIY